MHDLRHHALIVAVAGAFVLSPLAQPPTAQAGESTPYSAYSAGVYIYCSSAPDQGVVYFSSFFVAKASGSTTNAHNAAPSGPDPSIKMQNDFFDYLKHKYSFKSNSNYPTGCPSFGAGATGLSLAQASKKNLISQYTQAGKKIVETGWKYSH
jgi:hypothetical protein